ncbi:MAG: zinc metallopeptidase [Oscillospiraceae bacterium]|jgi:Zn-dependent membrane protease YugP|nr:zinc metallopeptidase [Oscillospiraceae bacterium]
MENLSENLSKTLEYFFTDPDGALYLVLIAFGLALLASLNVKFTFWRYRDKCTSSGIQAHEAARKILDSNGLHDVAIEPVRGKLTDHYDPRCNTVRLSESTYSSYSVAAIGVAAHECGHAIQYAENYAPIKIRTSLAPTMSFASRAWSFLIIIGFFLPLVPGTIMIYAGLAFFTLAAVFQLVTLPVEFNASKRAMNVIASHNILAQNEQKGAKKILNAAAMTYVAALMVSIAQLIRFLAILNRRR